MPIDSKHPLYKANIGRWQKCRDAYVGEEAVKARGQQYLPKVDPSQTDDEYQAYKARASYYEAVGRTVDGFVGAISRKPHHIVLPPGLEYFETHATADGTGLPEFIKTLCGEVLLEARGGLLVDFDDTTRQPYLALYATESVINWTATSVVLQETIFAAPPADPYDLKEIEQIRELTTETGIYQVQIWRKVQKPNSQDFEWQKFGEPKTPLVRGRPLTEMPWYWFSSMGQSSQIQKPPLLGLVNMSFSHYRTSADLEHGRHFTALPTLYVSGISGDEPIRVGAAAVIKLEDPQAKAGYAEFTGQGLRSLETALATKEQQMALLGAAIFANTKKGVEAVETARIRTAGENSLLMGTVSAVEETLIAALTFAAQWAGRDGDVQVKINRDFIDQQLNPQTIVGLVQAYQQGMIDIETFLFCLSQAEMLPPDADINALAEKLREAGPPQPTAPKPEPKPEPPAVSA